MSILRHVVLFAFKEEATAEQVTDLVKQFIALKDQVDVIQGFEWGPNVSPEQLDQGLTHCFMLTFEGLKELDIYQKSEAHQTFVAHLQEILAKVLVVDYFVQ